MDSIGLDQTAAYLRGAGNRFYEPRLSDYSLSDLWALWWKVGRALMVSLAATLGRWVARHRQRIELHELDAHMLRDIGVTDEQARRESFKLFWQE